MIQTEKPLDVRVYPPEIQGVGEFDGGRITETKPLAFPGEGPSVPYTGPPLLLGVGHRQRLRENWPPPTSGL